MSNENIYDGITGIREDIVQKVENYQFKKKESEKFGKKAWMKWGALAACLCLLIVAVPAIRNSTSTQEADTIELGEVLEWSDERVEKKLIGEYRGNILHSWGEPDVVLSETADKYYLDESNSKYIILHYDNDGYITEFSFGDDLTETADFGFTYKHIEGTFALGERVGLSVGLINQQEEEYAWSGSQSHYRAIVKLICNNGDVEYSILPEPIPDTDDISTHSVGAGETRTFDFYFTIPTDAVTGKYSLVCAFHGDTKTFDNVFELNNRSHSTVRAINGAAVVAAVAPIYKMSTGGA